MTPRTLAAHLEYVAKQFPIVTVTGPRQSGKTTLCRNLFGGKRYVSLEAPDTRAYAENDPRAFLREIRKGAVIDEVQRAPDLLSYLQEEVDSNPEPGRFVLTGSANFALLESVSQSLAGRTALLTLLPFSYDEYEKFGLVTEEPWEAVWRGGYPAIPDKRIDPVEWFAGYVGTYLERDVRRIVNIADLSSFQTFLGLAAARTGQLVNLSALGADAGITHNTARAWISVLEAGYIAFHLQPYHANIGKRLVKTHKLYFYDTGLACYLLGINSPLQLRRHPQRGALFETWVVTEILKSRLHKGKRQQMYFFRDQKDHEVDLLVDQGETMVAVEIKSGETIADDFFRNLSWLDRLEKPLAQGSLHKIVVYGGDQKQNRTVASVWPWLSISKYDW